MLFQDNVLRAYLENVYFITGTPCGGKTTISRALAQRHQLLVYDVDEQFPKHQQLSDPAFQPAMRQTFRDADAFFGRTVQQYKEWLLANTREQLDFVILDLIRLSQRQRVVCDCHLTVEQAGKITDPSRIVFLIKDPTHLVDDYRNRPDHQDFTNYINSATHVEKAKAVCNETLKSLHMKEYHAIKDSNYFWMERDAQSTVDHTVREVERHFGWQRDPLP